MKLILFVLSFASASAFAANHLNCKLFHSPTQITGYEQLDFQMQSPTTAELTTSYSTNANGPWTETCSSPQVTVDTSRGDVTLFSGHITCTSGLEMDETMSLNNQNGQLATRFGSNTEDSYWNCQWLNQ